MTVTQTEENGQKFLNIKIPMTAPRPSKSGGGAMIVASSGGNQPTPVMVDGKVVKLGLNAYIK